jgi:aspartate racemase
MLGILGGMGPLATVDFMRKLIAATPATRDQEHIPCLVYNVPQVPDRALAVRGLGPSPLAALRAGVQTLVAGGAQLLAMPCNTAHLWYDDLCRESAVPFLHIADVTVGRALPLLAQGARAAVLATRATREARLYESRFATCPTVDLMPVDEACQAQIDAAIRALKSGDDGAADAQFRQVSTRLRDAGATMQVLACTELPICAARQPVHGVRYHDTTAALAEACAAWWQGLRRP